jgi:hypothetical protein
MKDELRQPERKEDRLKLLQSETNDVTTDHIEGKSFIKEYHE